MTTSRTETEFVNARAGSADSVADSQALYSAYQRWVGSPFTNLEPPMTEKPFDVSAWLTRSLFANASGEQPGGARSQIGKHGLRHWIKRVIACCGFKHRSNLSKVGQAACGKGKHEVSKNLLSDVEDV